MRNRILTVAMVVTAAAFAAKIRVPSQQPTIQAGLNAAVANDTVLVAAGTYYERLTWPNRDGITLLSEDGAGSTAIDGGRAGRVITMTAMTYSGATLVEGFTVTNGLVAGNGAGIICNGSPTIGYNRIVHNVMSLFSGYGAGFYSNGAPFVHHNLFAYDTISDPAAGGFRYGPAAFCRSSGVFYENVFMENYSLGGSGFGYGGALYLERDNPVVLSNLFVRNRAENSSGFTYGGGLYIGTSANAFVANNTFVGNSVQASIVYGGAVYTANLVASIVNNVIVQNTSSGAIPYGGGIATGASATPYPVYDYNDLWSNVPANYYNCTAGPNAISANPEFKSVGWGDYFLSQVAAGQPLTSPCVDAGTVLPTSPVNMDSLIHAWTTRTDSVPDAGAADMGFHYHFLPWTHDVGVTRILSPGSISDTNVSVVPACS